MRLYIEFKELLRILTYDCAMNESDFDFSFSKVLHKVIHKLEMLKLHLAVLVSLKHT